MEQNQGSSLFGMEVDSYAQSNLYSVAKWGKFISITGLIILGLLLLLLLALGQQILESFSSFMPGGTATGAVGLAIAIALIFFGLYGAWCYFMLRASSLIKKGLLTRSTGDLAEAFNALKNFFIMSIVISTLSILSTIYGLVS